MGALEVSRRVVQAILNHKDWSITAVYDRYGLDREKREALTTWGRRVLELVELRGWPEASRDAVRRFGCREARLYPFLEKTVAPPWARAGCGRSSPRGPGWCWTATRAG